MKQTFEQDEVIALADRLAKNKGYISIWSMPFDKRMDFMDNAKAQIKLKHAVRLRRTE